MRKYMNNHFDQSRIFGKHVRFETDPTPQGAPDGNPVPGEGGNAPVGGPSDDGAGDDGESLETLKAELAKAKAEALRFKNTNDKLLKEKGELTKKNRQMMDADQLEKEAQEERDKRFSEMEKELRTNKYSKRLVGIGMSETDADAFAASIPELEDADSFFSTLDSFIKTREKAASDKAIQDILKSRPDINAGNGEKDTDDPAMVLAKAAVARKTATGFGVNQDILKNFI